MKVAGVSASCSTGKEAKRKIARISAFSDLDKPRKAAKTSADVRGGE